MNFYFWRTAVVALATPETLGLVQEQVSGEKPPSSEVSDLLMRAVAEAVARMDKALGSVDRPYGDWFRIGRSPERHYPVGGGPSIEWTDFGQCLRLQRPAFACSFTHRAFAFTERTADSRPLVTYGSRALRLVVLGPRFTSFALHNFGQSDDPRSPYWDDQAQLSSAKALRRVPFSFEELAGEITGHQTLTVSHD